MASSIISSATAVATRAAVPGQANLVAPFIGLKSAAGLALAKKTDDITSVANNGGRVQCMQV
ncbi:ribulose bisphosphate carboxylase small chain, partial [Genlisea aurea]